ncbi:MULTISPECIES: Pr6Pr family membrane protein [unclassified Rathayibacter]|uniref:Pr6Pr family membrane protein n=1 Tax=unclassified Rathayibacter TaxID=2609250 RepID=UPI001F4473AF|nr:MULTISPECIES: Pr6Pr family membrane protein [unclassified Rathayibacter]
MTPAAPTLAAVGAIRVAVGVLAIAVVGYAYGLSVAAGEPNPFDYFGYFTNQTSVVVSVLLVIAGVRSLARRATPAWFSVLRGAATTYSIVVAVIYNTLVPGTGSAPPWVSAALHVVLPAIVLLDWALVPDRSLLPWRRLWVVLPYPLVWLVVVLVRGATDGWVPYGFLLPENGATSLALHVVGLSAAVLAAGALVWVLSRRSSRVVAQGGPRAVGGR